MSQALNAEKYFIYVQKLPRPVVASVFAVRDKDMTCAMVWQADPALGVSAGQLKSPQTTFNLAIKYDFAPQLEKFFKSPVLLSNKEMPPATIAKAFEPQTTPPSTATPASPAATSSGMPMVGVFLAGLAGVFLLYRFYKKS